MGREIRRVPVGFDWPLNKVWKGFINPHERTPCPACDGTGETIDGRVMSNLWYNHMRARLTPALLAQASDAVLRFAMVMLAGPPWVENIDQGDVQALVDAGRLTEFTHRPRTPEQAAALAASGKFWMAEPNGYVPTAEEVNAWAKRAFGHDAINRYVVVDARAKRMGLGDLTCPACKGEGVVQDAEAEAWEPTDPPTGEGWQMWETVSEGSPVTPAFATSDELVNHMVGRMGYNWAGAEAFVRIGHAPSFVAENGHITDGVDAAARS